MSGLVYTTTGTYDITPGWFFYNGLLYWTSGTVAHALPSGGQEIHFNLSVIEGLPTAVVANATIAANNSFRVKRADVILPTSIPDINTHLGNIDTEITTIGDSGSGLIGGLTTQINVLVSEVEFTTAWLNIPGSGSTFGAGVVAYVQQPRFIKDGLGRVYLQGDLDTTSAGGSNLVNLPVGYRPSQLIHLVVSINGGLDTMSITIDTSGVVSADVSLSGITIVSLASIFFITL